MNQDKERFFELLEIVGWSVRQLSTRLNISQGAVRNWATGIASVPPEVMEWLEVLAAPAIAHPMPKPWTKGRRRKTVRAEEPANV